MGGRRHKTAKKGGKPRKTVSKKTRRGVKKGRSRRVRRARRGGMDAEGNLDAEELALYAKYEKLVAAADPRVADVGDEEVKKAAEELAKFEETLSDELKAKFEELLEESGRAAAEGDN